MTLFERAPGPPRHAPALPPDLAALLHLASSHATGHGGADFAWMEGEDQDLRHIRDRLWRDARRGTIHAGPRRLSGVPAPGPATGDRSRRAMPGDIDLGDAARAGGVARLCGSLIEPEARRLGDLWDDDDCTELDVTLALRRLLLRLRRACAEADRADPQAPPARVLVAPAPGEVHLLAAALQAEVLWQAGWTTEADFPASDAGLAAMLAWGWFDVLALSLSPAFRREDSLRHLARSIAAARRASRNPRLRVIVGGRAFFDHLANAADVGADAASASAADLPALARATMA